MKRKRFIQISSLATAGGLIAPWSCKPRKEAVEQIAAVRQNWAKNYTYKAPNYYEPTTAEELQELVKNLDKQKALGSRHCFNNIADSPGSQISTRKLNKVLAINDENETITVEAGARYGDFCKELHQKGFALHNLASLPHITVAGACTTATHGSGVSNGNLASPVHSVELITPKGELVTIDRQHPDFPAIIVGLGAFGIITKVTLAIEETFDVRQDVFFRSAP